MNSIKKMRFFQILLFIILSLSLTTCMSDDFDLKNGVNTDISLGGDSLSFPFGKTNPILLSSMIFTDKNDLLKTASDGSYSMQINDSTHVNVKKINPVTFSIVPDIIPPVSSVYLGTVLPPPGVIKEKTVNYSSQFIDLNQPNKTQNLLTGGNLKLSKSALVTNKYYYNIPNQNIDIKINKFVSTDVKRINILTLKTVSHLHFKIKIFNLHPGIQTMQFLNYTVQLPAYLKFNDPDVNQNNVLVLNNSFNVTDGFTKTLAFDVLDFNSEGGIPLDNGTFNLNSVATMHGDAFINSDLSASELGVFQVQPSIVIEDMPVSLLDGEITPLIDPITQKITLKLPDLFLQKGNILDTQNPIITLHVGNTMGFVIDAGLNLIPKSNGIPIQNGSVSTNFTVPAAAKLGQWSWTNYRMSKSNDGIHKDTTMLIVPELPNLFRVAPDEIAMNVVPVISGKRQLVDLYAQKNQLEIKYAVKVPLEFGQDFNILYLDTISNLKKDLDQVIKLTKQVEMVAFVENRIPLNLKLEGFALNSSNQIIPGISITIPEAEIIKACNSDGSPQKSTINLTIKSDTQNALNQLDALQIKVTATKNSAVAGIALNANQSMTIEMRFKIPHGVTITEY